MFTFSGMWITKNPVVPGCGHRKRSPQGKPSGDCEMSKVG